MGESTRTVLTPEQRVAKLEAELAEARAKAEAKNQKRATQLQEQRSKLIDQISERESKVRDIEAELDELGFEYSSVSVEDVVDPVNDVTTEDIRA